MDVGVRGIHDRIGIRKGKRCPCVFWRTVRDVVVFVHGDDFLVLAEEGELDWFRGELAGRFETKFRGRMGPDGGDTHELRVLNRVVRWDGNGVEYEADQRHAELICEHTGTKDGNSVVTPGVKQEQDGDDEELPKGQQSLYRG